ncbi:MAG: hypothetical protein JSS91_02840 [Bacteroidetes bacterium]|nr:hypothetical protein [Bacteroidota bacterium]
MLENLLKKYNELLNFDGKSDPEKIASLKRIFERDIKNNTNFKFRNKQINPVHTIDSIGIDILFDHLTTEIVSQETRKREFEKERSLRLHWIKYHIEETKKECLEIFSVEENGRFKTYIFDKNENYVIILEKYRKKEEYYLLTAYYLRGGNLRKIENKMRRKLDQVL